MTESPIPSTEPNVGDIHCAKSMQSSVGEDYPDDSPTIPTSNAMTKCTTTTPIDIGWTTGSKYYRANQCTNKILLLLMLSNYTSSRF